MTKKILCGRIFGYIAGLESRQQKSPKMPNPTTPAPISPDLELDLTDYVSAGFSTAVETIFDYTTDLPGFVAGEFDTAGPFVPVRAIARQACRRWARGDALVRGPAFDAGWSGICTPYLETLGEEPTTDPDLSPPFFGGQCVGVVYRVSGTYRDAGTGGSDQPWGPTSVTGPITGTIAVDASGGGVGRADIYVTSPAGDVRVVTDAFFEGLSYRITTITRLGGGEDGCGNPPSLYLPPQTRTGLPPLEPAPTYIPGIGVTPVDVTFDDNGDVVIDFPEVGITVTVPNPLSPGDGSNPPGVPPGFQGQEGDEVSASDGEPAEGEDETRNLVGVLVTVTDLPSWPRTSFNASERYIKGAYYVYFKGDAGYAQNPQAAIVRDNQFFYAPEGCNGFRVVPNQGVEISVRPFYNEES